MIIDGHTHVYPDKIAQRASDGIAEFYHMPVRFDGRVDTLLNLGKRGGISKYLISSVATVPSAVTNINKFIAETVERYPGVFIGLAALHPDSRDMKGDIERAIDLNLSGIKVHPDFQKFELDGAKSLSMFELFAGRLPALIHTGDSRYQYSNPARAARLMKELPALKAIGAHLGGWSEWDDAVETLAGTKNFYVDTSSSLYELSPERAASIVRAYGAERVIFGSDYPMWDPNVEIDRVKAMNLTEREENMIFSGTILDFFGMSD